MKCKLILCLPLAPSDIHQGLELAKLWADLEPFFNHDVTVLLATRFDMEPERAIDPSVLSHLRNKFKVLVQRITKVGKGWPAGCNALEVGAYEWFVEQNRSNKINCEYILFCEADTLPLRPTWLQEIIEETYQTKPLMLGAYFTKEEGCQHINGNAVMHRDLWRKCKIIWQVPPRQGWDAYIGKVTTEIGTPSRLIWQDYHLGTPHNPWKGEDYLFANKSYSGRDNPLFGEILSPCLLHGIKTLQGIDAVRNKYLVAK